MIFRNWFSRSNRLSRKPGLPEPLRRRALQLTELEDRVLYSAAPIPTAEGGADAGAAQPVVDLHTLIDLGVDPGLMELDADHPHDGADVPAVEAAHEAQEDDSPQLVDVASTGDQSGVRHELVFVDSQVEQHSELMDALRENSDPNRVIDIVVLDANRDGVEQITEILSARRDVDAVHVLSHGADGALKLGDTWLHGGNLGGYAGQIAQWQNSLSSGADLLLYGCDLAATEKGLSLIESLHALIGADVAASTNDTGAARLGGDWNLEAQLGSIETRVFGDGRLASWDGSLAPFVVTSSADSGVGSLRQAITDANALPGLDTITFNISGVGTHTINLSSGLPIITDSIFIDGWSQPGYSGTPVIVLDGNDVAADGLHLSSTVDGSTIRGLVIRDFNGDGIEIAAGSDNNTIVGNYIGRLTAAGLDAGAAEANTLNGLNILGANNAIGGTTAGAGNVLSGNNDSGITITGAAATGNLVQGNLIGTNAAGTAVIANNVDGILIDVNAANNTIGGTTAAARNVIAGNLDDGIELDRGASGNIIRGNFIGTDVTGTVNLGNRSDGILVNAAAANNQIGGTVAGAGNLIAFNVAIGIDVISGSGNGNSILGNSIHSQGGLGIDLGGDGVTANDVGDGDTGVNNLQNYPSLTTATTDDFSTVTVSGTLNSTASSMFRVEFFASATADASGFGEGARYLGFATVMTDSSGNASFNQTLLASVAAGEVITSTATNSTTGDTSEFSANVGIYGIVVTPTAGLTTTEDGGTASFSVFLSRVPTANVTINISSSDTTEGTTSVSSLTFTPANWNVAQIVTVTGVSDFLTDGDVAYSIITSAASSGDTNYNNRNAADVSVINQDGVNDAPINNVPGSQSTNVNTVSVFSSGNGNLISISDVDAGPNPVQVTLTATNGTLTLPSTSGLVFSAGDGTADASMTFSGTLTSINTALDGLAVTPTTGFVGTATLQVTTNDLGNSGSGGARSDTDTIPIEVVVEERVNTTTSGNQVEPSVAMDADGDFVVVWTSDNQDGSGKGIFAQRYDQNGVKFGSEFRVNTTTAGDQVRSAVAMDATGDFVVTWASNNQDGDKYGVYAQRFSSAGVALGGEFLVNVTTSGQQDQPAIAMESNGDFVIVWKSDSGGTGNDIFARRFDSAGVALGGEFRVNSSVADTQDQPAVAMDANGGFVVVWKTNSKIDGSGKGVFAQRFDSAGVAQGGEFQVNTTSSGDQEKPTVAMSTNGDFVIAWKSGQNQDGDKGGIFAQRYNSAAVAQGTEFRVNTTTIENQDRPTIGIDASGSFTVAWASDKQDGNGKGIYAQRFLANGTASGGEFRVNSTTSNDQDFPALAMSSIGDLVVAWQGKGAGDSAGIFEQLYRSANDAPVNSVPAAQSVNEDATLVFSSTNGNAISISDVDAFSNSMRVTLTGTNGLLTLSGLSGLTFSAGDGTADSTMTFTGSITAINTALDGLSFAPIPNFYGAASLSITTNDQGNSGSGGALSDTDLVSITVNEINDAPVANDDSATTNEDNSVSGNVLANDSDPDNTDGILGNEDTLTAVLDSGPMNGLLVFNADGSWTYTPNANFFGSDCFRYHAVDSDGASSNVATVTLTVNEINDAPFADDDAATTNEDNAVNGNVLTNDCDPDNLDGILGNEDTLTAVLDSGPANGSLVFNADGSWSYTPNANFFGTDNFTYHAVDSDGASSNVATVTITINEINDAPVANDDSVTINEDNAVSGNVLANDIDPDNTDGILGNEDTLTAVLDSGPMNGLLVFNSDGSWTYTPNANFFGTDNFGYHVVDSDGASSNVATVTIIVNEINDMPVANDDSATTNEDSAVSGNVLANDSDPDNLDGIVGNEDTLTAVLVAGPTNGSLVLNADGSWTYTPDADFSGFDSFSYQAVDSRGLASNVAAVSLTIDGVNDAPVNNAPGAAFVDEDSALVFSAANGNAITVGDVDVGGGMLGVKLTATHGTLTLGSTTNLLFVLGDGVADQDMIFAGTQAELNTALDGLTFTPDPNFNGSASIEISTRDMGNSGAGGEKTDTDTIDLTVLAVNDAPVASGESYSVSPNTPLIIGAPGLLGNDGDIDGDSLQAVLVAGPNFGTVAIAPDGSFVYTPQSVPFETDTFTYQVSDGQAGSNVVTVTITMTASGPILMTPIDPTEPPDPTTDDPPEPAPTNVAIVPPAITSPKPNNGEFASFTTGADPNVVMVTLSAPEFVLPTVQQSTAWVIPVHHDLEALALDEIDAPDSDSTALESDVPKLEFSVGWLPGDPPPLDSDTTGTTEFDGVTVGTTVVTTFSLGYVLWSLRGGHLLTTFLATMPAWRLMDPLPVLQSFAATRTTDEEHEDDGSLAEIVRKKSKATSKTVPQGIPNERQA